MSNFKEDLDFSMTEETRRKNYAIIIRHFPVKTFKAVELDYQKTPNDFVSTMDDGTEVSFEFKNYRKGRNANIIYLEQKNDIATGTLGWTFNIKADYVIFVWHGKTKECYLILHGKKLSEWWKKNYAKYPEKLNKPTTYESKSWRSSFSAVPIHVLPRELIVKWARFIDLTDFW